MGSLQTDDSTAQAIAVRNSTLRIVLPLLAASAIIWLEPLLGQLAQDRPGIVPVALLSLVVGLISPGSRRWLVVTLCFGVGLLALRDGFRVIHLPTDLPVGFQAPGFVRGYALGWAILAVFASAAAVGEALQPGAVWARRCYFLAAAVYFAGHGLVSFLKEPTWQSPVLVLIGLVALLGAWMADRVVDVEPDPEPLEDDLQALVVNSNKRSAVITEREWVEKR